MRHAALGTCKSPAVMRQLAPAALSVAWGDCGPVRETPRRGGLSIVIGANMVTMTSPLHHITSMSWIREICLSLFVFDRSNLCAQQKPLRPRKFKSYNSSWQRPAQTIQIRADKNMSADFCHELLLEEMQSRAWELHESCISWCLGRILEWNAVQPSIGNWRLSVLLPQTKRHWRSYSSCTVSRKRWEWWWLMPCPREYSQYSQYSL